MLKAIQGPKSAEKFIEKTKSLSEERSESTRIYEVTDLNDRKDIDQVFFDLNQEIRRGDFALISFENPLGRRQKIYKRFNPFFGFIYYNTIDLLLYRVLARMRKTRKIFLRLTQGKNQAISTPEVLGRVCSCNFDIESYQSQKGTTLVLIRKREEIREIPKSQQGIVIGLKRIGYQGKVITVWKIRTMSPYSEFLQSYLLSKHGTMEDGDKIINDFRVTRWGKTLRKIWIDEIPMLWNYLKGDLKLIGVRPLSKVKFQIYPKSLQAMRVQVKPGLLPPYYADLPTNQLEFYESEKRYTEKYLKAPFKTDVVYFLKIFYNIICKGHRSK